MAGIVAGMLVVALVSFDGSHPSQVSTTGGFMAEQDIRAESAKQYSELLRIACLNGWKFRRSDVAAGFKRHFEEMRLVLVDRGVRIVPLAYEAELQVAEVFFGMVEPPGNRDRRACFRARWQKPTGRGSPVVPAMTPVAN